MTIIRCAECKHWERRDSPPQENEDGVAMGRCRLAEQSDGQTPTRLQVSGEGAELSTAADFGCNLGETPGPADQETPGDQETTPEDFWTVTVPRIEQALAERNPGGIERFKDLSTLLSNLQDYTDAIRASMTGMDPECPLEEAVFGDSHMEETIQLLRTLPTMPEEPPRQTGQRSGPEAG